MLVKIDSNHAEHLVSIGLEPYKKGFFELILKSDTTQNGFNTIVFDAGKVKNIEAYLDTRYESGGPYQLTSTSIEKIVEHLNSRKRMNKESE